MNRGINGMAQSANQNAHTSLYTLGEAAQRVGVSRPILTRLGRFFGLAVPEEGDNTPCFSEGHLAFLKDIRERVLAGERLEAIKEHLDRLAEGNTAPQPPPPVEASQSSTSGNAQEDLAWGEEAIRYRAKKPHLSPNVEPLIHYFTEPSKPKGREKAEPFMETPPPPPQKSRGFQKAMAEREPGIAGLWPFQKKKSSPEPRVVAPLPRSTAEIAESDVRPVSPLVRSVPRFAWQSEKAGPLAMTSIPGTVWSSDPGSLQAGRSSQPWLADEALKKVARQIKRQALANR